MAPVDPLAADSRLEGMVYVDSVPVKYFCAVDNEKVKTFSDLVKHFEGIIAEIKKLEADGWHYDSEQSFDWLFFEHTDRSVVLDRLGEEYVKNIEEAHLETLADEGVINPD